ncbi:MAG: protein kinase [Rhodanobacteraceae bacterium]|nr:protein kinase [Rhodanobacteraceae bacterium]MBP9154548.1 protein kinase [Xanthomonadales bacterium]HQW80289.1 protein kinase [Pseudomonadota bacterium]
MSSTPAFNIPGYELIRELGVGGMATVHLAIQSSLDRKVAIKVMRRNIDDADKFERRFLVEGRTLAKLPHRNIVAVYDIVKSDAATYISMEYLEGGTLHEKMRDGLSLAEAVAIVVQIAGALQFAHDHSIVHRDLKPANIMFRDELTPVLTDFGIARQQDASQTRLTQTGMLVGTPTYMSPEQINALEVDGRSDLYSLGVMFYELLTGHPPFQGETPIAVLMAHLTNPPPPLPQQFAEFQPILDRMLAKGRDDRYGNLKEFTKALKAIVVNNDRLWERLQADPNQSSSEQLRALGFSVSSSTALEPVQHGAPSKRQLPYPQHSVAATQVARPNVDSAAATQISSPVLPSARVSGSHSGRGLWIGIVSVVMLIVALAGWWALRPHEDIDPRIRGEIDARLVVIDRYIGDQKLTPPPIGDNALDLLQAVQQRAPNYSGTTQRTLALVTALKTEAQRRKDRGEYIDAEAALGFASSLAPDDAAITTLRAGIADARTRSEQAAKVKELLAKADEASAAGRDLGADSAYALLRQAAQLAPADPVLGAAQQKLLTRLLASSRAALLAGDISTAQSRLDALAAALGNDPEWRKLRDEIAAARNLADRAARVAAIQAQFDTQLRARRYAEPAGDNALESLSALRLLDTSAANALGATLANALLADARALLGRGDAPAALTTVELALRVQPDAAAVAFKTEVEGKLSADQRRVAGMLGQVQQALAEHRYFAPAGQNATELLDQLLRLDPSHGEALRLRDGLMTGALDAARALAQADRIDDALALANQVRQRYPTDRNAPALVEQLLRQQSAATAATQRATVLDRVLAAAAQRPLDAKSFKTSLIDVAALLKNNPADIDAATARQRLLDALRESADSATALSDLGGVDAMLDDYRRSFGEDLPVAATVAAARTRLEQEERVRLAATAGDLVLLALPWGEVESVTDLQRKSTVPLPVDRVTPLRLHLPAGVYRVSFKHPSGARSSTQATVKAKTETVSSAAFAALDAKEYLRRAGL